jgi:hypothetical protein
VVKPIFGNNWAPAPASSWPSSTREAGWSRITGTRPGRRTPTWDDRIRSPFCHAKVTENGASVLIVFPVGVRMTHLAAIDHIAIRHRLSVIYSGALVHPRAGDSTVTAVELIIDDWV